jgi:NAD(P)-dependent dehydrogenase (short-subunit alcohol dehydrogenase family)
VTGPLLCTQAAVKMMREANPPGGSIVNILDYGAARPWVDRVDHSVSKAALMMLTQISAVALGADNIRVNAVLPGPVMKSPGMTDEQWHKAGQLSALKRTGDAEDVGRAVAYLVSEDYLTGTILHVNGGEHL